MKAAVPGKCRTGLPLQKICEAQDLAEGSAQIMRDRMGERLQLLVGGLELSRASENALLQFRIEAPYLAFRKFALRDVTDVALNHFLIAGLIDVADKLHVDRTALPRFQPQVFIVD